MSSPTRRWQSLEMLYQTAHQQRMMAGMWVAVEPVEAYRTFREQNSLVRNILNWQWGATSKAEPVRTLDLKIMAGLGFSRIVVSNAWLAPENATVVKHYLTQVFGPPPSYPQDRIDVYEVAAFGGGDPAGPLLVLTEPSGGLSEVPPALKAEASREAAEYKGLLAAIEDNPQAASLRQALARFYEKKGAVSMAHDAWLNAADLEDYLGVPERLLLPAIREPLQVP